MQTVVILVVIIIYGFYKIPQFRLLKVSEWWTLLLPPNNSHTIVL